MRITRFHVDQITFSANLGVPIKILNKRVVFELLTSFTKDKW